jgi:two-component system, NtrC family, sensor kinase
MNEQIKILCVDDEENVLKALKRLFFDEDYEIITAASAEEGLKVLEKESAHIVISDYRMPSMSGVEFLKEVCVHWPDTVRIVLSGYADISSIISAINEGQIYKFIPKPWNDSELKVTVSNAIERYFLYKKNRELTFELQKKNEELTRLNVELENLLEKETANLEFQGRVLRNQQNLLDVLPVGIIGIDSNNTVVMCNSKCIDITRNNQFPLEQNIEYVLPESILPFIEEVKTKKRSAQKIELYGIRGTLMGSLIEHTDNQKGLILVFIREDHVI